MKRKFIWVMVSGLVVVALLLAACAPAPEKEAAPAAPAAPAVKETAPAAPTVKETAPAVKEAAPAVGANMVKVTLTKLDGTKMEKLVEKPKYGGECRFYRSDAIISWDDAFYSPWRLTELSQTHEELVEGNKYMGKGGTHEVEWNVGGWIRESASIGGLAESWEIIGDDTLIFHIRKGVRFHNKPPVNGREFTAADAVFNIKRIYMEIPSSTMYGMAGASRPIDVYATDKYTVVVKSLKGHIGRTWEYVGDWLWMLPPEVIQKYGSHNQWEYVIGTGPFILTDYVSMSSVKWVRNPNYWGKDALFPENQLPYLDSCTLFIIPDKSTEIAAIRTGKVEMSGAVSWEDAASLIKTAPQLLYMEQNPTGLGALIGLRLDYPELPWAGSVPYFPWKNPSEEDIAALKVRRALYMAINNQEVLDTYFGGKGEIVMGKVMNLPMFKDVYIPLGQLPPAPDGFDNNKLYGYYPEEAKKLLAEAGYSQGFKVSVITSAAPATIDQLQMLKAYWTKIGVDLTIDIKDTGVLATYYLKKTFKEGYCGGRWSGEPYAMHTVLGQNTFNWSMIDDPTIKDYYNRMAALSFKEAERDKVMKEANQYVISQVAYFMTATGNQWRFWWPWVKNYDGEYNLSVGSYQTQKYLWVDQALKKSMGY